MPRVQSQHALHRIIAIFEMMKLRTKQMRNKWEKKREENKKMKNVRQSHEPHALHKFWMCDAFRSEWFACSECRKNNHLRTRRRWRRVELMIWSLHISASALACRMYSVYRVKLRVISKNIISACYLPLDTGHLIYAAFYAHKKHHLISSTQTQTTVREREREREGRSKKKNTQLKGNEQRYSGVHF